MHSSGPPGAPGGGLGARPRAPNPHPARIPGSGSAPGHPSQMKSNSLPAANYGMTSHPDNKSIPISGSSSNSSGGSGGSNATTPSASTPTSASATTSTTDKTQRKAAGISDGSGAPASSEISDKDSAKPDGPVTSAAK